MKAAKAISQLFCFLITVVVLQSCGPGDPGVWKNDAIKSGRRENFHKLNDELFEALKANKTADVENLMSKDLLSTSTYKRTIELISLQSKMGSYNLLDEYYIINYRPTDTHTIKTTALDGSRYTMYCATITEEMYIAFMIPKTRGDKYMVTMVYHKYNYGWKLNTLDIQPYTITGKTAPQLYKFAQQKYARGYLTDALNTMQLADKIMTPNEYWQYPQSNEMYAFEGKMADEFNKTYKFPLVMNDVATKPQIFNIERQTTDEGVFPDVYYLSSINLKDTNALKRENESIKQHIGKLFPGIDKDKKYIYFSVFNEKPTGKKSVQSFDISVKLN